MTEIMVDTYDSGTVGSCWCLAAEWFWVWYWFVRFHMVFACSYHACVSFKHSRFLPTDQLHPYKPNWHTVRLYGSLSHLFLCSSVMGLWPTQDATCILPNDYGDEHQLPATMSTSRKMWLLKINGWIVL